MTEANRSMEELPAILEERRKYEGWLAALDARRESTPKHVFERVKMDYEGRLRRVEEELSAHRHTIQEERASLSSRLALLEADEQLRRDERAELELRVHVGELTGEPAESAFSTVDESLEHIVSEKDGLMTRIADLNQLLDVKPSGARSTPARPAETHEPAAPVATSPTRKRTPAASTPVDTKSQSEVDAQLLEATAEHRQPEDEGALIETTPVSMDPIEAGAAGATPRTPSPASSSVVPDEGRVLGAGDNDPRRPPGETFDELAFLSDLVGDGTGTRPNNGAHQDAGSESLLAGLGDEPPRGGEAPLASNVPGHTPIAIRVSGAIEQVKTLKCTECGAMNYPTEWYCERCGAELAAL